MKGDLAAWRQVENGTAISSKGFAGYPYDDVGGDAQAELLRLPEVSDVEEESVPSAAAGYGGQPQAAADEDGGGPNSATAQGAGGTQVRPGSTRTRQICGAHGADEEPGKADRSAGAPNSAGARGTDEDFSEAERGAGAPENSAVSPVNAAEANEEVVSVVCAPTVLKGDEEWREPPRGRKRVREEPEGVPILRERRCDVTEAGLRRLLAKPLSFVSWASLRATRTTTTGSWWR